MSVWACGDTSKEQLEAAGLAKGCTLSSDCKNPLVCVFQLCHDECADTADCLRTYGQDSGARCVSKGDSSNSSSEGGAGGQEASSGKHGVCTFPDKVVEANPDAKGVSSSCKTDKDCPGAEKCGSDGQCRDGCTVNSDCIGGQICANSGDCADATEVDASGNLEGGAAGAGTGGSSSTGGTGGTGGKGGTVEGGGGAGDTIINECPDTSTMNPVEHDYETIDSPVTWTGLHHITTGLIVNAALTLSPCAVLKFDTNGFIVVNNNGAIKAVGKDTSPVVFTSDKTSPKKGDWGGIDIQRDASNDSTFKNVIVEYSGSSYIYSRNGIHLEAEASASLENVLVRYNGDGYCAIGLDAGSEPQAFDNVRIESSAKGLCVGSDVVGSIGSVTSDVPIAVDTTAVSTDATWQDFGVPYRMDGTLTVNAKLTLAAGVTIQMPANGNVNVDNMGSLVTLGTADEPVTFTSAKSKPLAGDWGYVYFGQNAGNETQLTNTVIEYGGANYYAVDVANNATAGFDTVTISDVGDGTDQICGIQIENGAVISQFDDVTFKNSPCPIKLPSTEVGSLGSLTADAGNIQVSDTTIGKKTTWKNFGIPYELNGTMYVQQELDLAPGVTILMPKNGQFYVNQNGAIKAAGTSKEHVVFDSALDGAQAGDWYYIYIDSTAAGTSAFSYVDFVHGGGSANYGSLYINGRSVEVDNCSFSQSLDCDYTVTTATGSKFDDGGGNASDNDMNGGDPYQCGT